MNARKNITTLFHQIGIMAGAFVLYILLLLTFSPRFETGTYHIQNKPEKNTFDYPLLFKEKSVTVEMTLPFTLGMVHPTLFRLTPDNCLTKLIVNGQEVKDSALPACDYVQGHVFYLAPYLRSGKNEIRATIKNYGGPGGLHIRVPYWDQLFLMIHIFFGVFAVLWIRSVLRGLSAHKIKPFLWVFAAGTCLRFVYWLHTPYNLRSHDVESHIEYIRFVLLHFRIPPAQAGWEYYQPPLYYFINALLTWPLKLLGANPTMLIDCFQAISLGLSIITLGLCIWLCRQIWPQEKQRTVALVAAGIFAVFPGHLFFAARISNDVLLFTLSIAFFCSLFHWWKTPKPSCWYLSCILVGLGLLTKSNAIALVPILFLSLALRKGFPWRAKTYWGIVAVLLITIISGWLYVVRFGVEGEKHLVGNIGGNNSKLKTELSLLNFFTFNPAEVIRIPRNSPWSDTYGRNHFWEHLLKSSFTGEWNFGEKVHSVTRPLLALSILFLLIAFFAFVRHILFRPRDDVPFWITPPSLVIPMMFLISVSPIGGFQDFRYVPLLLVPVVFYLMRGISSSSPFMQKVWIILLITFIVLCLLFTHFLLFDVYVFDGLYADSK